jgi:hypothetical protein
MKPAVTWLEEMWRGRIERADEVLKGQRQEGGRG